MSLKSLSALFIMALCVGLFSAGCQHQPTDNTPHSAPAATMLRITGSDTMVHLATKWAEDYMQLNPTQRIAVNGGGSGNGIAALLKNATDIAPASRNLKPEEKTQAKKKATQLKEIAIAQDAIALVIHPSNPIKSLSLQQISDLYTGKITNWQQLGGPNKKVLLYSRETSSGTYEFFQEHVLNKQDFTPAARLITSTAGIIETVAQDEGAIGYVGAGFASTAKDRVKTLGVITTKRGHPIYPTAQTIKNKTYPISRDLYLIVNPKNLSPQSKQFIVYCKTNRGQQVVQQAGFLPMRAPVAGRS